VREPNTRLRQARERTASPYLPGQPLTRQELAELLNAAVYQATDRICAVDGHYIGKLERGSVRWPHADYRTALRVILHADTDADLGFRPHRRTVATSSDLIPHGTAPSPVADPTGSKKPPKRRPARTLGHGRELPADAGIEQLWSPGGLAAALEEVAPLTGSSFERRQFLALSGVALATAAHEWLLADPARIAAALAGKRVDTGVVTDLTTTLDALRRLDDKLGGQAVHGMVTEQLRLVVRLLRNTSYTQADGQGLYGIAAELARLAGWTSYDAGQHGTAHRYYLVGLRAAHEADAPGIGANILRCMAEQASRLGDPRSGVELLRSARAGARGRLTAVESAALVGQLAIAHGRAHDRPAAQAAAEEAREHIGQARPGEAPPYAYWVTDGTVSYDVGVSMIFSGDPAAAIPHLQSAIDRVDLDMPRDLLEFQATAAFAHARSGNPDEAVRLVHHAIDTAPLAFSPVVTGYFEEALSEIRATGHPGIQDLTDHLGAITQM